MCLKCKLKNRMAWIEETNSEPYEYMIVGIETLHFTSSRGASSIAVLGRILMCPVDL